MSSKAVLQLGYHSYVMDTAKAVAVLDLLGDAEIYEEKWQKKEDGGTAYFIYPQDAENNITNLKILPPALYRMAKLAGKPQK